MDGQDVGDDPLAAGKRGDRLGRGRRRVVRILAGISLLTASLFPVFVAGDALSRVGQEQVLEPAGSPEAQYGADHPAEAVHVPAAIALEVLVVLSLGGLMLKPGNAALAAPTGAIGLAMLLAAWFAGDPDNYGGQGLPVDPAFVALALPVMATSLAAAPWWSWRGRSIKNPRLLVLGAVAAPAFWYGVGQALIQRNTWPPLADPHHQGHWVIMAELALVVPLAIAGGALTDRGSRPTTVAVALAAIAVAVASIADPHAASSLASPAAVAVALWGAAVLAAAWTRSQPRSRPVDLESGVHRASLHRSGGGGG